MNYDFTEDQRLIKDNFSRFCRKEIEPKAASLDRVPDKESEKLLRENIKKLASLGYLGMAHEEKYGGSGLDTLTQSIAGEEVARACASTYLSAGASCGLFGLPLRHFGSDEQKRKYLPGIISGEKIGCFGLTEPGAGSDAAGINTRAEKKGGKWIINGTKTFITNAPVADAALIFAYTDRNAGPGSGITSFIVESGTPGFVTGKPFDKMGFRGSPTSEIFLDNCAVDEDAVLGQPGRGFAQAMKTLEYGRIGMATVCLGIAVASMEAAECYSRERQQFGKPINRFQEVGFKLADMMIYTDLSRLLIYRAAWAKDTGDPESAVLASCAKLFASEAAARCADMAVQIHGGYGYMKGCVVERLFRDARLCEIGEGTSEIQRGIIAGDLIKKYGA